MKYKSCPECRSNKTETTDLFAGPGYQRAFKNRVCLDCGTAWQPACPRVLGMALIVLGCLIPPMEYAIGKQFKDMQAFMNNSTQASDHSIWPFVVGGVAVTSGVSVLIGLMGKMKIFGKVKTTGNKTS